MHTLTLILAGLTLLALFYALARWTGRSLRSLLPVYLATWFAASAVNMWVGVLYAGYAIAVEALVFLPVFGVPAVVAVVLSRRV